ncbi:SDR family NAD(P)-dependent oxidoreductase [Phototrophicus methaneseepsis]|uniref:SDR family NAD(P)-dependent oxidoreductase n=1 Tax=Phototrophicus methaneseepsis TaxID=2710758 RepID=A0A7S8IGF3_9CHLR|nr:oxidoreductase [Phototrophicus methaneseepsis]QPC84554.1 SDR family NAD(P)-dependent oxidoreductase [Phototrophicus methaneseepsis]
MSNNNQVVLVTGASSGIGKATAKQLVAEGYIVYTAARRIEKMDDLKRSGCHPLKMDITKEEDVAAVVQQIKSEQGGVDILINSAGFGLYGAIEDVPLEAARYQFDVNVFGLARLTQLVLPYMREKQAGKIINIASIAGKIYSPMSAWYMASKHALEGWSDCLRVETKPFNIDVIIIEPGSIDTEFDSEIANDMLKYSGEGAYSAMAKATIKMINNTPSSSPTIIANVVSKAIKENNPKPRYLAGNLARPMLLMRQWGGDRLFDWILQRMIR